MGGGDGFQRKASDMITTRVLEANIVHHCNNRCACCNHGSPFSYPYCMEPSVLKKDLSDLKSILHTEFFCLQGGEPLLHHSIVEMIQLACASGIADRYGILTNGRLLLKMTDEFWKACQDNRIELRMTVYGNVTDEVLKQISGKVSQYSQIKFIPSRLDRFTKVLGFYPEGDSFRTCRWKICHAVHEGRFYICPLSIFWPKQFMGIEEPVDGFAIEGATEEDLNLFIYRTEPLKSCQRCTGEAAASVDWHEVSNLEEWIKDSTV
jgi:GTP 3',8-cyclase